MSEWISVEDRLPTIKFNQKYGESKMVLVVVDGSMINPNSEIGRNDPYAPRIGIGRYSKDERQERWAVSDDAGRYFGCRWNDKKSIETWGKVTHWQPLPGPPND